MGHSNNSLGRFFNILKGGYHNRNIYTLQDMVEVLNYHEQVKVIKMKPSQLLSYNQFFKQFYKLPQSGTINITYYLVAK